MPMSKRFDSTIAKLTDAERFVIVMSQIVGKRLTYDELTGKTESGAEMRP